MSKLEHFAEATGIGSLGSIGSVGLILASPFLIPAAAVALAVAIPGAIIGGLGYGVYKAGESISDHAPLATNSTTARLGTVFGVNGPVTANNALSEGLKAKVENQVVPAQKAEVSAKQEETPVYTPSVMRR